MHKKLAIFTLSYIFGMVLTAAYAETAAVDNSPPKVSRVTANDAIGVLLERAKYWESHDRIDLAREALEKLFLVTPDHPDGLAMMGLIEAKEEHLDSTRRILSKLRSVKPDHPAISRIEALIRLYGEDKDKLRQARLLAKTGHTDEALTAFRKLYPNGPPGNDLAFEYWQLVADTKDGWMSALNGLVKLVKENPENLRYRLALAEHETSRLPFKMQALQVIIDMAKIPEYSRQARKSWRSALLRLENLPANLPLLAEYLAAEPNDSAIKERQQSIIQAEGTRRRMIATSQYRAKAETISLMYTMDLAAAKPLLDQALQAHPENAYVVGEMGLLRLRLEQTLRAHPKDADVVGEMGLLRMRQGKHAQAHELFTQALHLTQGKSSKWQSLVKTSQFWQLMREARDARKAGDFVLAENSLNAALKIDPNGSDAIAVLGDVQADRGQFKEAERTYRQALSIDPLNGGALEGLVAIYRRQGMTQAQHFIAQMTPAQRNVLIQTINRMEMAMVEDQADDPDDFLSALARIPADKRPENISRLWGKNLDKLANAQVKSGRKDEAIRLLQEAETLAANDEVASLSVATTWGKLAEYKQADRMFDNLRTAHTPPSTRWHFRYADYLAMKEAPELRAELDVLAALPSLSPDETHDLYGLQESLALRTAYAQLKAGTPNRVHDTLAPFLKASPDRASLLLTEASAYQAEKQWSAAQAVYAHVLQLEPGEKEAIHGLIETLIASGDRAAALAQLDELAAGGSSGNAYYDSKIVDWYLALDERGRAKKQLVALLAQYPNDSQVLNEAWHMAQSEGRLDDEIVYLKKSIAAERAELAPSSTQSPAKPASAPVAYQQIGFDELGSPQKIQRDWKEKKLAALIDQRSDWFSSAIDMHSRSGTSGLSQFNSVEIPLEYKMPWHTDDEVFFRTDMIRLDAGSVDPAGTNFGSLLLCQPACKPTLLRQDEQGMSFTAGYQHDDLSADIGFTPLNFPVSNVVGGIRQKGDLGQYGYSIEASRRPLTSSLLSFAGTKDPFSGLTWGGVVAVGGSFGLSLDKGETFGFWSSISLHSLTGRNVQTNQRFQLMAGEQWRVVNEENRKLVLGLTEMYWHFSENAGEYTFGHGGYYSPLNYRSLSLPVTYAKRTSRFSYMLRAAISASQSQTKAAPFYPTNSVMQAQAVALAPINYITPVYSDGSGSGTGYSLKAAWEYQVKPKLFVGGMLALDRSESYAPNQLMFYLRYSLDHAGAQPVFLPPEPIEPSSQF